MSDLLSILSFLFGTILSLAGIIIPVWIYRASKDYPFLAPVAQRDTPSSDFSFPDLVEVRNRSSAPATDILGVIFPAEVYLDQHPHGARYVPKQSAVAAHNEIKIYRPAAEPRDTNILADWQIDEYTFGPKEPGVISRLTLTYQDEAGHSYASIFDKKGRRWIRIAYLKGFHYDIADLEEEYQRRVNRIPLLPPPSNSGVDRNRRRLLIIFGGIAAMAIGITGVSVGAVGLLSSKASRSGGGPGPSPTPSPTPTPTHLPPPPPRYPIIYSGHKEVVHAVAWSPDGKRIASGSADKTVQVWDPSASSMPLITYKGHSDVVFALAWSPDGQYITSGSQDQTVQVWEATTGTLRYQWRHTNIVQAVAWSPDGQYIASGGNDYTIQVHQAPNGETPVTTYTKHTGNVTALAWSPDSKQIASASEDGTVQVWEALTGNLLLTYRNHHAQVHAVAWATHAAQIASGGSDNTVLVWEATTGNTISTYTGHPSQVNTVAWSPDGQYIASGATHSDDTVQVSRAAKGSQVFAYSGHHYSVFAVGWSPDGRLIASGSGDWQVHVWPPALD